MYNYQLHIYLLKFLEFETYNNQFYKLAFMGYTV